MSQQAKSAQVTQANEDPQDAEDSDSESSSESSDDSSVDLPLEKPKFEWVKALQQPFITCEAQLELPEISELVGEWCDFVIVPKQRVESQPVIVVEVVPLQIVHIFHPNKNEYGWDIVNPPRGKQRKYTPENIPEYVVRRGVTDVHLDFLPDDGSTFDVYKFGMGPFKIVTECVLGRDLQGEIGAQQAEFFQRMDYVKILNVMINEGDPEKVRFEDRKMRGTAYKFTWHLTRYTTEGVQENSDVLALYDVLGKVGTGLWRYFAERWKVSQSGRELLAKISGYRGAIETREVLKIESGPEEFGWSGVSVTVLFPEGRLVWAGFEENDLDQDVEDSWFVHTYLRWHDSEYTQQYVIVSMRYDILFPEMEDEQNEIVPPNMGERTEGVRWQ